MTTPAPAPTLSLATDKTTYNVGDTIQVTATYADSSVQMVTLTVSATATDAAGNSVDATTTAQVAASKSGSMDVSVTDSFSDAYTQVSNDGVGTAVFTATVGSPPAGV